MFHVNGVSFSAISEGEISSSAVVEVENNSTMNESGSSGLPGGIYDPQLGTFQRRSHCKFCNFSGSCPGHMGVIRLPTVIFNPFFVRVVVKLLRRSCPSCNRFRVGRESVLDIRKELEKVDQDYQRTVLDSFVEQIPAGSKCENCRSVLPQYRLSSNSRIFSVTKLASGLTSDKLVLPAECCQHLESVWTAEQDLLIPSMAPFEWLRSLLFLDAIAVPPNQFRPLRGGGNSHDDSMGLGASASSGSKVFLPENAVQLVSIMNAIDSLKTKRPKEGTRGSSDESIVNLVLNLQQAVHAYIDSSKVSTSGKSGSGIRQLLERKEGLFRMHMMGKRVNYAARSVISPDISLQANEIGIPQFAATILTRPEIVNRFNVERLRAAVTNGPDVYPGATHVRLFSSGRLQDLQHLSHEKRVALASMLSAPVERSSNRQRSESVVFRHIRNGDMLLVNRQPTLHKPSIMAHKARMLPSGEKTIRMHYANCHSYNADFDGDEINLHLLQDEIAQSEAMRVASNDLQFVSSTSGKPLRGLIQDHVVSGTLLTKRDTFLSFELACRLLLEGLRAVSESSGSRCSFQNYRGLQECGTLLPLPCVLKPTALWSGKQVISSLISAMTMVFCDESLQPGVGLHTTAKCRVSDNMWGTRAGGSIAPNSSAKDSMLGVLESSLKIRDSEVIFGVLDKNAIGNNDFGLIHCIYELLGPSGANLTLTGISRMLSYFLQVNGFTCALTDMMLKPSADVERNQLIQETLDKSLSGKGLASLTQEDRPDPLQVLAGIENGVDERKRAMIVGSRSATVVREALTDEKNVIDRVVRSNNSQQWSRVIEALIPQGALVAFPYNGFSAMVYTGAKGSKVNQSQISCLLGQQELEGKRVPTMRTQRTLPSFLPFDSFSRAGGFISDRFLSGIRPQEFYFHCMAGREGLVDTAVKTARSGYLQRCLIKSMEGNIVQYDYTVRDNAGSMIQFKYGEDGIDVTKSAFYRAPELFEQNVKICKSTGMFPADMQILQPSELLSEAHNDRMSRKKSREDREWMSHLFTKGLADPGEAVGVLASQAIGEPATQMTLNTFHLAGHGGANVTLGIPRLRELFQVASKNIGTPLMVIPAQSKDDAESLALLFKPIRLSDLVENCSVSESTAIHMYGNAERSYSLSLGIVVDKRISREEVVAYLKGPFIDTLDRKLRAAARHTSNSTSQLASGSVLSNKATANDVVSGTVPRQGSSGKESDASAEDRPDVDDDKQASDGESSPSSSSESSEGSSDETASHTYNASQGRSDVEDESHLSESDADLKSRRSDGASESEGGEWVFSDDDMQDSEPFATSGQPSAPTGRRMVDAGCYSVTNASKSRFDFTLSFPASAIYSSDGAKSQRGVKLLLSEIALGLISSSVVRNVKGVQDVHVLDNAHGKACMNLSNAPFAAQLEGINFDFVKQMSDQGLDLNGIYCNSVCHVLEMYGVEAARAALVKEIRAVFNHYGVACDIRHLYLLADSMTRDGVYTPFNRRGIHSKRNAPLLKMSFETSTQFIMDAVVRNDTDYTTKTPSGALCSGAIPRFGTGMFDILADEACAWE